MAPLVVPPLKKIRWVYAELVGEPAKCVQPDALATTFELAEPCRRQISRNRDVNLALLKLCPEFTKTGATDGQPAAVAGHVRPV